MPILLVKIMDWAACAQNYGYQIVNRPAFDEDD